jgi:hypothetical protein
MDLRNLSSGNAGCVFEIRELLDTVPAERLVFVVDRTTDQAFLEQTWRDACKHLHAAPNEASLRLRCNPTNFLLSDTGSFEACCGGSAPPRTPLARYLRPFDRRAVA